MAKRQTAQEQNQVQVQNQVAQNQQNEQPQVPQEQTQVAQEQTHEQSEQTDTYTKLIQGAERVKLVLDVIKDIKTKLESKPVVRQGIKDFHDSMMAESESRAAAHLKAKEESDDSNVVTRKRS